MKFILGSVQWGLNYGISNSTGKPNRYEVEEIINFANKKNIYFVDTAIYTVIQKKELAVCVLVNLK